MKTVHVCTCIDKFYKENRRGKGICLKKVPHILRHKSCRDIDMDYRSALIKENH